MTEKKKPTLYETFKLHDAKSVKRLTRNDSGYENSPQSYHRFMMTLLASNGGVLTQDQLESELLEHFRPSMGPDDLRMMNVGKRGAQQPKWRNSLAWAKVTARKQNLILQRTNTFEGEKTTWVVMRAFDPEHYAMQEWASGRKVKKMKKIKIKRKPSVRRHKMVLLSASDT